MNAEMSEGANKALQAWAASIKDLEDAKRRVRQLECEVTNSTRALGKLMVPASAKVDETFNLWVRDGELEKLLCVRVLEHGEFEISWRR